MDDIIATKVVKIMLTADGGSIVCAEKLVKQFAKQFPEHGDLAIRMFEEEYDVEWYVSEDAEGEHA